MVDEDNLTPIPHRKAHRPSLHNAGWREHVGGALVSKPLTRESSAYSTTSGSSKARTLGSTFGGDHLWSPKIDPEMMIEDGPDYETNRSTTTLQSQAPLIITKKPPAALLKTISRKQLYPGFLAGSSRASSVYSTASATSSVLAFGSGPPRLPSLPRFPRTITMRSKEVKGTGSLTRTSSVDSSTAYVGGEEMDENKHLRERLEKIMGGRG